MPNHGTAPVNAAEQAEEVAALEQIASVAATMHRAARAAEYAFEITRMSAPGLTAEAAGWLAAHVLIGANCCDEHLARARATMEAKLAKDRERIERARAEHQKRLEGMVEQMTGKPAVRH